MDSSSTLNGERLLAKFDASGAVDDVGTKFVPLLPTNETLFDNKEAVLEQMVLPVAVVNGAVVLVVGPKYSADDPTIIP